MYGAGTTCQSSPCISGSSARQLIDPAPAIILCISITFPIGGGSNFHHPIIRPG